MSTKHLPCHTNADIGSISCVESTISAPLAYHTDIASPSVSLCGSQSFDSTTVPSHRHSSGSPEDRVIISPKSHSVIFSKGVYKQDDIVGQYLIQRDFPNRSKDFQAPELDYTNTQMEHLFQDLQSKIPNESYISQRTHQSWYPDPESIRHLHTLHSLLPHIQPERKLNALNGPKVDMVEGHTGKIICYGVPKKMLTLFLGRGTVTKFLHTLQYKKSDNWIVSSTQQVMILPHGASSVAALKILTSWMMRACKSATMYAMEQIRLPVHLFAACSLAQTMELLGLRRDADRVDSAISRQFLKRPIYAVEVESLWRCLGGSSKYLYACIKALKSQPWSPKMKEEFEDLAAKCPELYARICDHEENERHLPEFGRVWFEKMGASAGHMQDGLAVAQDEDFHNTGDGTRGMRSLDPSAPKFNPGGATA